MPPRPRERPVRQPTCKRHHWGWFLLRHLITALAALLALAGGAAALGAPRTENDRKSGASAAIAYYSGEIVRFQKQTWHWQRVMGVATTPAQSRGLAAMDPRQIRRVADLWRKRSDRAYRRARRPPHLRQFLCIQRYEARWTDTGDPYWGGLQMDRSFQRAYGGYLLRTKGTADRWSPLEQIWVAEKALRSRGFSPWPNTARSCGLL